MLSIVALYLGLALSPAEFSEPPSTVGRFTRCWVKANDNVGSYGEGLDAQAACSFAHRLCTKEYGVKCSIDYIERVLQLSRKVKMRDFAP